MQSSNVVFGGVFEHCTWVFLGSTRISSSELASVFSDALPRISMTASAGKLLQTMTAPHDTADTLLVGKSGEEVGKRWAELGQ